MIRYFAFLAFLLVIPFVAPSSSLAAGSPEKIFVTITLNSEAKGDFLVHIDTGDDIMIRDDDLRAMGVAATSGTVTVIDGQKHLSLRSLRDLSFTYDKKTLTLAVVAPPGLLSRSVLDLTARTVQAVVYPRETSVFLNYGLNYYRSDIGDSRSFTVDNKLGVHAGDLLFLTDTHYAQTPDDSRFVRLMSSVTYERRSDLQWFIAGDTFSTSGELGSTINVGGLGLVKVYRMNPYLITHPTFGLSGAATLPAEASIYLDGMLMRKERIPPGRFDLQNLNYYGGSRLVEVVLTDAYGGEQRIAQPFYFTDALLQQGLHEYGYTAGALRRQYGVESNDYGDAAFSAIHRYGVNDGFTIGGRAEATRGVINGGPLASFLVPRSGVVSLVLAASKDAENESGYAGSFRHGYQRRRFSTRLQYRRYSRQYVTIQDLSAIVRPKSDAGAGVSYDFGSSNTISLDVLSARAYDGSGRDSVSATYSDTITKNLNFFITSSRIEDKAHGAAYEIYFGLNYLFGRDIYLTSLNRYSEGVQDNSVQVYRNNPNPEGLSYRAELASRDSDEFRSYSVNPAVQYKARYGIYSADLNYNQTSGQDTMSHALSAAGSVVYAGGLFGLSRPVNDSFSIVKVDGLKGVNVKLANMDTGATDASGTLVLPEVRSYGHNQISVDPAGISMDYQLSDVNVHLSPSQWSGSCLVVTARKFQAYTGRIVIRRDGSEQPVEMSSLKMQVLGREFQFLSGLNGEFYFESRLPGSAQAEGVLFQGCRAASDRGPSDDTLISPGMYPVVLDMNGVACRTDLEIPVSDDVIVDIGNVFIRCDSAPKAW